MASSALGGDRRWGSTRRSGMKVLGKVAVPKPINLPSERLENHGLDPNVEIVPKGTVSWGTRSSPLSQNAWGSSLALPSPTSDGTAHPGHLNNRPSSGGSGTRPSTAGSERSHDPASSAWGTNSRPSSASGLVTSSHSSGSLRPRSAETRPGSSQLSRFAETVAENSGAWGGSGNTERLSSPSSFTLSSGDFPTLGSERSSESNVLQGQCSHGRPSSSSSKTATQDKSEASSPDIGYIDASGEKGVCSWNRDEPLHPGVGPQPNIEKWQNDSQQALAYTNPSVPPQHWHGPPVQNAPPDGSWYRGGPPPGPYGPAAPPGSYSVDPPPYGYYQPQSQIPARPIPNQQMAPRPGIGAGGYGPPNGDFYQPHMADSYPVPSHPVMPVRYPGPMPPYDGYYGSPRMNFCNQSERDAPVLGMAGGPGPSLYHRYHGQNVHPDSGKFHARPCGYGPAAAKGQVDSTHAHDPGHRGPYKVLLKQHDGWGEPDAEQNKEPSGHMPQLERGNVRQASPKRKNEWEADIKGDKAMEYPKPVSSDEASPPNQMSETMSKLNLNDNSFLKKQETAENLGQGTQFPLEKKNMSLIDKIEGLNSKSRISDGRYDPAPLLPTREDKAKRSKTVNESGGNSGSIEKAYRENMSCAPFSKDALGDNKGDRSSCEITFGDVPRLADPISIEAVNSGPHLQRRAVHGMHGRGGDYKGRARFSSQENEEWKKKSIPESDSSRSLVKSSEVSSQELTDEHELNVLFSNKTGGAFDKAQRAKLKEIATQRAKEEEERTREQKAKALAKLEELNRRTLRDNVPPKSDGSTLQHKHDEVLVHEEIKVKNAVVSEELSFDRAQTSNSLIQSSMNELEKNGGLLNHPAIKSTEVPSSATHGMDAASISSASSSQIVNNSSSEGSALQVHDNGSSKQKQIGHNRRNNISNDKNRGDGSLSSGGTVKVPVEANANAFGESFSVNSTCNNDDSFSQHKKKHMRNSKSKHKVDDTSESGLLASAPVEGISIKSFVESGMGRLSEIVVQDIKPILVADTLEPRNCPEVVLSTEKGLGKQIEEAHGKKIGNQWKPQSSRRASRNSQAVRVMEKFHGNETVVWAPVQPLNKQQQSLEQAGQVEGHQLSRKGGNGMGNNVKTKRAEMERYVPKPVAKELSLQSNSQPPPLRSPPLSSISDEMSSSGNDVCTGGIAGSGNESKPNKLGKKNASWRQRNPNESHVGLEGSCEESVSSFGVGRAVEKLAEEHPPSKSVIESHKQQEHGEHSAGETDEVVSIEEVNGHAAAKDHGVSGRGRRQTSKFGKGGEHYQKVSEELKKDSNKGMPVELDIHTPVVEPHVWDGKKDLKTESRQGMGSHWQPKGPKQQNSSNQNQYGNRGSGSQRVTVRVVRTPPTKDENLEVQPFKRPQVEMQKPSVSETTHSHHQETKFENKHTDSSKEGQDGSTQGATENTDFQIEKQQASWGVRKQSQHNGRFQRGHGGWGGSGLETHKQQAPLNGDRKKPYNSHYEYQPVESHFKKSNNAFSDSAATEEVTHESSGSSGLRYKERGQNTSRRGVHYHGRNSGGAVSRVAAS